MSGRSRPRATIDSNVWHQAFPRYLITNLHLEKMCQAQWSDLIRKECEKSLQKPNPGLSVAEVTRALKAIHDSIGDYLLLDTNFHRNQIKQMLASMPSKAVPDHKDVHVMYLANLTNSDYLVTNNLKHFPSKVTKNYQFKVTSLDDFFCEMMDAAPTRFRAAITRTIVPMRQKGESVQEILNRLGEKKNGYNCPKTRQKLDKYISAIEADVEEERQKLFT